MKSIMPRQATKDETEGSTVEIQAQEIDKVFCELQRVALNGCEIAEKVVQNHHKRPCFKKIDLLCGRLKQDLTSNNNVVANINSQGVAWAVKDFIFVFTRIINAWVIMRGYVYNKSDGLDRVKASIDPNLNSSFLEWQEATHKFANSLVKSYVNLDSLVQHQKASKDSSKNEECDKFDESSKSPNYDAEFLHDLNRKLFDPSTVENSEETQRQHSENGTYFKSAVYHPLQKISPAESGGFILATSNIFSIDSFFFLSARSCEYALNDIFNDETIEADLVKVISSPSDINCKSPLKTSTPKVSPLETPRSSTLLRNPFNAKLRLAERFDIFGFNEPHDSQTDHLIDEFKHNEFVDVGDGFEDLGFEKKPLLSLEFDETKMTGYNSEMAGKIRYLINKVLELKEATFFISPQMVKDCVSSNKFNYFLNEFQGKFIYFI